MQLVCEYLDMLSKLFKPIKIACNSSAVNIVLSILYPSAIDIPPSYPWVVTIGIPALQISSISRLMVLRDTSNFSARNGAVTLSFWSKIVSIPIKRLIFI